jgi:HNH endonuclease
LQEGLARRKFGLPEIAQTIEFFGEPLSCVFCGSLEVKRWDHLIAVTHSGETVLGNMVPACASCDDSKQHKSFEEWMRARASKLGMAPDDLDRRLTRLSAFASAFGYTHTSLGDRLTDDEKETLNQIRERMTDLRVTIEELIAQYRIRTGSA